MQLFGVFVINLKQLIMKGTLRLFLVLCITALSMTLVQAQERTYSGVVKGSDGQPIIGASVEVVGTTVGTSTGLDGDYTIKAKQGSKIKYSFLGTKSVTATAGTSSTINVTLEDDAMGLEEVVVQAFGTAKKKDLTGSFYRIHKVLGFICQSRYASAAPSSLQFTTPASSGISLQMTLSVARTAPASLQLFSQFLIHSPSPHP